MLMLASADGVMDAWCVMLGFTRAKAWMDGGKGGVVRGVVDSPIEGRGMKLRRITRTLPALGDGLEGPGLKIVQSDARQS